MVRRKKFLIIFLILISVSLQAAVTPPLRSFNSGVFGPFMEARSDFLKYKSACRTLENMLVLVQGPVSRRPGTKYIATVKDSIDETRVWSFEYSKKDTYVVEGGDGYMRVFRNGSQVLDPTNPYEIATPWDANDVFEIQYVQSANTMYLVHPSHPPQELTRTAHTTWTINDFDIETGPFLDENTDTTEDVNSTAVTGSVTLNSNFQMFDDDHVGSLWRISHFVDSNSISSILDANESSDPNISVYGDFDFSTHGTWTGYVALERSDDNGSTWIEIPAGSTYSKDDSNIEYSDSEDESGILYQVTMSQYGSGTCTYNLLVHSHIYNGVVKITAVTDANTATATVLSTLSSTDSTHRWSEGAWSDYRGWPETVEFHEERLIFGGSASYPQTIWFGAIADDVEDYNDFTEGVDDDDAFTYVLPGQNPIQWLLSQNYIMIGTLGGVGRYGSETEPLTPTTPEYRTQAKQQGSAYIQAVMAGDAILYVERGGTKVREFVYNLERDRFVAPDMTIIAEHITRDGIVDIAYQSRPDSVLWCVLESGDMATMTYQRDHEVVAWALQTTEGDFESVTVIPGTDEDEVWVVVNRTIDSSTVRYIEQFQPRYWGTDQTDCYFVDSGLSFEGGDAVNITDITRADPAVVTVSVWPTDGDATNLGDGDEVMLAGVGGMTEVNDNIYTIDDANAIALTFSLDDSAGVGDVNSVGFTAYTSGGTAQRFEKNFSGLGHLKGEEVAVFTDGGPHQNLNVTSSTLQISEWSNKVLVGLPYTSIFETLPLVFDTQSGSTSSMDKRIINVSIDFYQTLGASYGVDSGNLTAIDFSSDDDPVPVFSGWKECSFQYGSFKKATVYIETAQPIPLTIRALEPLMEILE